MTARERGKETDRPSQQHHTIIARPGEIRISVHKSERLDRDFLRQVLMRVFNKSEQDASIIVRTVDLVGSADCGAYSRQVAETKVDEVRSDALRRQIPIDMRLSRNDASINKAN